MQDIRMLKNFAPLLFTTAGVAVAGVLGYNLIELDAGKPNTEQTSTSNIIAPEASQKTEQQNTPAATKELEAKTETAKLESNLEAQSKNITPSIAEPELPEFDLLRVEKDGSAVVAGSAPVGSSEVELIDASDGNKVLGTAKVLPSGDFAIVLDKPMKSGSHELYIVATKENGEKAQSADAGLIEIPKSDDATAEPVVIVSTPGKPTRVLQNPEIVKTEDAQDNKSVDTAPGEPQVASLPDEAVSGGEQTEQKTPETPAVKETNTSATDSESVSVATLDKKTDETKPAPSITNEADKTRPVRIEAADIENGNIYIAGVGEPNASLNLYLDGGLLGTAQVNENGVFLFEGKHEIKAGRYPIRADMIDANSGKVIKRAEVSLLHDPKDKQKELAVNKTEQEVALADTAKQPSEEQVANPSLEKNEAVTDSNSSTVKVVTAGPKPKVEVIDKTPKLEVSNNDVLKKSEEEKIAPDNKPATELAANEATQEVSTPDIKEIRTGSAVIIRRGDNLWTVARRNYGNGIRYTTIFDANRDQVRDPDLIYPGQILKIPEQAQSNTEEDAG